MNTAYRNWMTRHLAFTRWLAWTCFTLGLVSQGVAVWVWATGRGVSLILAGMGTTGVLWWLADGAMDDMRQLRRAIAAWDEGANEIRHLPERLLQAIDR